MKKTFIVASIVTTLIGAVSYSADHEPTKVLIQFKDDPGLYFIKIEAVKGVNLDKESYISLNREVGQYEQSASSIYRKFINLPDNATDVRISIRKIIDGNVSHIGQYAFIDANELREIPLFWANTGRTVDPGIRIANPFRNRTIDLQYKIAAEHGHALPFWPF